MICCAKVIKIITLFYEKDIKSYFFVRERYKSKLFRKSPELPFYKKLFESPEL